MKIQEHLTIVLTLLLSVKGVPLTHISLLEGETFTFQLSDEINRPNVMSFEWSLQTDRRVMLAIISLNGNEIHQFTQRERLTFKKNGSMSITHIQHEDAGNYTCKIIFQNGNIQTYDVSLTLRSGTTQESPLSSIHTPSVPQPAYIQQFVIPVTSGAIGLALICCIIIIILKCRKKHSASDQCIYENVQHLKKNAKEAM